MGNTITTWAAVCLSFTSACGAPAAVDPEAPDPRAAPVDHTARPWLPDLVAFTAGGDLAVVDGVSGAVRSTRPAGAGADRDLVWDPWARRVVVLKALEGDESGEIEAYPILRVRRGFLLGERDHLAWVDGRARILAAPAGVVVFEESYGTRWKLLGSAVTPSVPAPPPLSAWISVGPSGDSLHALSITADGAITRLRASLSAEGIAAPDREALGAGSASARMVEAPAAGGAVIADIAGKTLRVRAAHGETSSVPLPAGGMEIASAVPIHGGAVVAFLMSGVPSVIAVALDADGVPWSSAHLPLAGEVARAEGRLRRDLAVQGNRLLVATSMGVQAVRVAYDEVTGVALGPVTGFHGAGIRGPIAVLNPPP